MKPFYFFVLVFLLLSGCSTVQTPSSEAPSMPFTTSAPKDVTVTSLPPTMIPSSTSTPTKTYTPTVTVTITPTKNIDATATAAAQGKMTCKDFKERGGYYLFTMGQYIEAIDDFDQAIALDPKCNNANWWRGIAQYYLGNYQEALKNIDKQITLWPGQPNPFYWRGIIFFTMGEYQKAIDEYDKGVKLVNQGNWVDKDSSYIIRARNDARAMLATWSTPLSNIECSKQIPVVGDASYEVRVCDPFDKNDYDWYEGSDRFCADFIENGKYRKIVKSSGKDSSYWSYPMIPAVSDFEATIQAQVIKGAAEDACYGIIYRGNEQGDYRFYVCENQTFSVELRKNFSMPSVLLTGAIPTGFSPGKPNWITVVVKGDQHNFFVNQEKVGSVEDATLQKGRIGTVESVHKTLGTTFEFDNFMVRTP